MPVAAPRHPSARCPTRGAAGFTLVELMLVLGAIGILAALALPTYSGYRDRVQSADAATDIGSLAVLAKSYRAEYGRYPAKLSQAMQDVAELDPWGDAYHYLAIEGVAATVVGQTRKDKNLVPINSDFDLYSAGPDQETLPPLMADVSRDDIVRASDGAFVGIAEEF
jgi:general secretion pathway protein G